MAKEKGKKFKGKGKKIGQPNAKIKKVKVPKSSPTKTIIPAPAPLTYPAEATASDPESNNNGGVSQGKEKEREKTKCLSGFIFLCNPSTKLECYQYRVFGLPLGKKEVVEEIKPGTKLFLFDFELKLLYGIYEATSAGNLNLEPTAFRGKFPAQVKFRIFKECLPLPESSLRHVIKENYTGSKFKQELSKKQVAKLLSSFRPLAASSSQPAPQARANVSLPRAMPPSAMENQFKHRRRLPVMEVPYLAGMQYSHTRPLAVSQTVPMVNFLQPGYHRTAAYVEHVHPTLDHPSFPVTSSYYLASSQRPSFTEGVAHGVQEPPCSRCRAIEERAPHAQVTSLERYMTVEQRAPRDEDSISERQYHHQLPLQREALYQDNVAACNSNPSATTHHTSSVMQTQVPAPPYHQLPLQRGAKYQDSIVAYNTSNPVAQTMEQRAPRDEDTISERQYHHQLPLQREVVYQDNMAAYNSNPSSATAHYTSSVIHTHVPAPPYHQRGAQYQDSIVAYSTSNPAPVTQAQPQLQLQVLAQYASSVTQPQVVAHAPITSYYTYSVADQLSHRS